MFCPNCKAEYREGISRCPVCDVILVNALLNPPEPKRPMIVTIYKTRNPAIVAFLKSALKEDGIEFWVKGENDPFSNDPAEFQVHGDDSERAIQIVSLIEEDRFRQGSATENGRQEGTRPDRTAIRPSGWLRGPLVGFIIGALISGLGVFYYYYTEKHYTGVIPSEIKKDSKPVDYRTYENGVIQKVQYDRNFDGKTDAFYLYKNGVVERGYSDEDFDGEEETSYVYDPYGLIDRVEIDANHDNKPEITDYYSDGVLWKRVWRHESTGVKWKEANFSGGVKREEYIDTDYDGKFDVKIVYNSSERPISEEKIK